jgi:hypothetical protein
MFKIIALYIRRYANLLCQIEESTRLFLKNLNTTGQVIQYLIYDF